MTIHRLALITILLTFILIVFGGFVASSESGMGCGPEWPLCNGAVIPELSGETLIEFAHRVIGAVLAVFVVTLFMKIKRAKTTASVKKAAYWMIVLLALQVTFGAIIVILDLPISIIITHLYIAMAFMTTLLWIWRSLKLQNYKEYTPFKESNRKFMVHHMNICLILLLLTLGFGGYIKHQHSHGEDINQQNHLQTERNHHNQDSHHDQGSHHESNQPDQLESAFDWLFKWDSWIPLPNDAKEIIEATHLSLAIGSALYILFLTYLAISKGWESRINNRLKLASTLVIAQITVGLIMAYIDVPIFWAVLHLAFGTTLLINVIETRVLLSLSLSYKMEKKIETIA